MMKLLGKWPLSRLLKCGLELVVRRLRLSNITAGVVTISPGPARPKVLTSAARRQRGKISAVHLRSRAAQLDPASCYVDGSVLAEGAGVGVYYSDGHPLNYAASLRAVACSSCSSNKHDNNVAELAACYAAVERHPRDEPLKVYTDSAATLNTLQRRAVSSTLKAPGPFMVDRLTALLALRSAPTLLEKVPAHASLHGNEMADRLASKAVMGTVIMELPLTAMCGSCSSRRGVFGSLRSSMQGWVMDLDYLCKQSPPTLRRPPQSEGQLTSALGLDCEMVGALDNRSSLLASVCLVNDAGEVVYRSLVKRDPSVVGNYRTWVSGISREDLLSDEARDFELVKSDVAQLAKNRVIVGHDIVNDLRALQLEHPVTHIRDTAYYEPFLDPRTRGKRKLKTLAALHLGLDIQRRGEPHSPRDDAIAAIFLYLRYKRDFDAAVKTQTQSSPPS